MWRQRGNQSKQANHTRGAYTAVVNTHIFMRPSSHQTHASNILATPILPWIMAYRLQVPWVKIYEVFGFALPFSRVTWKLSYSPSHNRVCVFNIPTAINKHYRQLLYVCYNFNKCFFFLCPTRKTKKKERNSSVLTPLLYVIQQYRLVPEDTP